MIRLGNHLARLLAHIAEAAEEASRRLNRCEHCGRSKFYGRPCRNAGAR